MEILNVLATNFYFHNLFYNRFIKILGTYGFRIIIIIYTGKF